MKFDDDFFKAEVREGFEITSMMKRAWAAQMEVFQVVADVCRKNKLRYFADWGTLLGAVRHKGMIPWDDDIDICLMREEYNELIKILPRNCHTDLLWQECMQIHHVCRRPLLYHN